MSVFQNGVHTPARISAQEFQTRLASFVPSNIHSPQDWVDAAVSSSGVPADTDAVDSGSESDDDSAFSQDDQDDERADS